MFRWLKKKIWKVPLPDGRDYFAEPPADYLERINLFAGEVANCMGVSRRFGGLCSPTGKHFWASALFTSLVTRAVTLVFSAPYGPWSERDFEHWDYASVANIVRTMTEIRISFFYLAIEECSPDEWDCRWNLYNLHDCTARIALMNVMGNEEEERGLAEQAEELRERLRRNSHFQTLSVKAQSAYLKGQNAHLYKSEDIAVRAGIDEGEYKMMWKFMSAHVHALPLSFYRLMEGERGNGVQTRVEENYTKMLLSFALVMLVGARDEYVTLMESAGELERMEDFAGTTPQGSRA